MKLCLALLLLIFSAAHAQIRVKLNYNKHWELCSPDSVVYIRMTVYDTTNFTFAGPVTDLYRSGRPQMKGEYRKKKKHGEFTFYYENGSVESTGLFLEDERVGIWRYYNPDGSLRLEADFKKVGHEDQAILFLNDSTGNALVRNGNGRWVEAIPTYRGTPTMIVGQFVDYRREGKWIIIIDGKKEYQEIYRSGQFISGLSYTDLMGWENYLFNKPNVVTLPLPYKLLITEKFAPADGVDFTTYPMLKMMTKGVTVLKKNEPIPPVIIAQSGAMKFQGSYEFYVKADISPQPKGNPNELVDFVTSTLKYPAEARKRNISGTVLISFVVEKDGTLDGMDFSLRLGGGCDEEAMRVLKEYAATHKWNPGKLKGKFVRVRMHMSVRFSPD